MTNSEMDIVGWTEQTLGLSYEKSEDWVCYDPESKKIYAPNIRYFFHEVCHYLMASEEDKERINYGLGSYEPQYKNLLERQACLLEQSFYDDAEVPELVSSVGKNPSDHESFNTTMLRKSLEQSGHDLDQITDLIRQDERFGDRTLFLMKIKDDPLSEEFTGDVCPR